jgi:hypothetical protein
VLYWMVACCVEKTSITDFLSTKSYGRTNIARIMIEHISSIAPGYYAKTFPKACFTVRRFANT